MTPARAAVYVGVGSVLVALLASASGSPRHDRASPGGAAAVSTSGTDTLADDVRKQTSRLAERLAAAPAPRAAVRNPFTFAASPRASAAPAPQRGGEAEAATVAEAPPALPEPRLELIGVAASTGPAGVTRTAMLLADGDTLLMVKEGETIGARFEVGPVTDSSVELTDLVRGGVRRLALR